MPTSAGSWVQREHARRRLPGSRAEIEDALDPQSRRRPCNLILEPVVRRHLLAHHLEIAVGIPMELAHVAPTAWTSSADLPWRLLPNRARARRSYGAFARRQNSRAFGTLHSLRT
jgi:hypothetical protein